MNLLTAHCQPKAEALDDATLAEWLAQLPGWELVDGGLRGRFEFDNFYQVMAFANAVADLAHAQDHHPDLGVHYDRAVVRYSTHDVGGLSSNDFICAAKADALFA